jgi:hypothetical protein
MTRRTGRIEHRLREDGMAMAHDRSQRFVP